MKALSHIASDLRYKSRNDISKSKGGISLKSWTNTCIFSDVKNSHHEISKDFQWSILELHTSLCYVSLRVYPEYLAPGSTIWRKAGMSSVL